MPDALKPGATLYAADLVDGRVVVEEWGVYVEDDMVWMLTEHEGDRLTARMNPGHGAVARTISGGFWLYRTPEAAKTGLVGRLLALAERASDDLDAATTRFCDADRDYLAAREQVEAGDR